MCWSTWIGAPLGQKCSALPEYSQKLYKACQTGWSKHDPNWRREAQGCWHVDDDADVLEITFKKAKEFLADPSKFDHAASAAASEAHDAITAITKITFKEAEMP